MKCISLFKCNPQIEVIDKSHCSLEDVPNFQSYYRSLEELCLDANKLTVLNENLFRLTRLRRFSFSDNAVQEIPPGIVKLSNLVELDCSRNNILSIPEEIKHLKCLRYCDFSANNIECLPEGFSQLKNLNILTLNYCPIRILPDDFGLLKNLESLELRENELEYLPASISDLENLKKLDLGRNLLKELPDDIGRLKSLEYLLVDGNSLDTIPPSVGLLEKLQCLDLCQQERGLKFLPEDIGGLKSLTDLHLSENHILSLPNGIKNLRNLTMLKADNNFLTKLNPAIGSCTSLQELVLTSNRLTELPTSIEYLLELHTLNVDSNLLEELTPNIGNLKKLCILSLRDNLLTYLPNEIGQLDSLSVMDVSGNRIEYLPITMLSLNLKALWLSENQAKSLPKLQIDELDDGSRVLTCYLLPQQGDEESTPSQQPKTQFQDEVVQNFEVRPAAVSFDDAAIVDDDLDSDVQFVRHNTPHPKELRARHQNLFNKNELKGQDNPGFDLNGCQILDIVVMRSNSHRPGLGLSIAGGKDTPPFKDGDEGIFVSKVTPNGASEAAGVKVGDKILAVNNITFPEGITHHKAVEIFRKIKPDCYEFALRVLRDPNFVLSEDEEEQEQEMKAQETNGNSRYNQTQNKSPDIPVKETPAFVRTYSIPIQSQANTNGLSSGRDFRQSVRSQENASAPAKSSASVLSSGTSFLENSMNKNIVYTTLVKDYQHDLGLVLEQCKVDDGEFRLNWSNIVITQIKPDSIAAADGKLQVNDRILSINGSDVSGVDLNRVKSLLESTDRFVRIVVSRGESDDPLCNALKNMPTRPPLGNWFSNSSSKMSQKHSLSGSYRRPQFGSVNSLQGSSIFDPTKPTAHSTAAIPGLSNTQASNAYGSSTVSTRLVGLRSQDDSSPQTELLVSPSIGLPTTGGKGGVDIPQNGKEKNIALTLAGEENFISPSKSNIKASPAAPGLIDVEQRLARRQERYKSFENDMEMARLIAEARRIAQDEGLKMKDAR